MKMGWILINWDRGESQRGSIVDGQGQNTLYLCVKLSKNKYKMILTKSFPGLYLYSFACLVVFLRQELIV